MKCCSGGAAHKSLVKRLSGGQHGVKTLLTRSFPLFKGLYILLRASLVVQTVKNLSAIQETWVRSLDSGRSPGEGMGLHSFMENSMDSWQLLSMGSQRIGHDSVISTFTFTFTFSTGRWNLPYVCLFLKLLDCMVFTPSKCLPRKDFNIADNLWIQNYSLS